jgi:hypothetical protein
MRFSAVAVLMIAVCSLLSTTGVDAVGTPRFPDEPLGAAIGSPGETVSGKANAGVVHVFPHAGSTFNLDLLGSTMLTRSMWPGEAPAANDRFGESVAVGDLNGDGLTDVAIGAPGVAGGSGRVYVAYRLADGSFDPAVLSDVHRQGAGAIVGTSEAGDRFGAAVHVGRTSGGDAWLAIGAPGEDISAANGAGAVTIVLLGAVSSFSVYQGKSGLPGTPESADAFGAALADFGLGGLAIGAPGEDIGAAVDAGHVIGMAATIGGLPGSAAETGYQQGVGGVPGTNEPGDRFGAALYGRLENALSIGVPGEDVGSANGAGAVIDSPVPGQMGVTATSWYQGKSGLPGTAESGDAFGAALSATNGGSLVVGAPGEDVGSIADAGIIHVLRSAGGMNYSLTSSLSQVFHCDTANVPGIAEAGDRFGASLGEALSRVLVGVPGEDVGSVGGAGAIVVLDADALSVLPPGASEQITQDVPGVDSTAEAGDAFGASVAGRQVGSDT